MSRADAGAARPVPRVTIDRIAPTQRPNGRVAQRQSWRELSFLHWRVPVSALRALVPPALEIDTFDGDAFIGVVPFTMTGVRPLWAPPVPGISNFHETNVRTYVHHAGQNPGVWFFSLDAASRIAVTIARTFWDLPYHYAKMTLDKSAGSISYTSERITHPPLPAICNLTTRPRSGVSSATPGTLEHFLAERYILYADGGKSGLRRGRVHHPPYPLQTADVSSWEETLVAAAGLTRPQGEPIAHYASRVDVEIFALQQI
jgi:uncharacterized protein YqjF (DUF2071 family)